MFKKKDYNLIRQQKLQDSLGYYEDILVYTPKKKKGMISNIIIGIVMFGLILFNVLFARISVSGPSMLPTLKDQQHILLYRYEKPNRFDIGVFRERIVDGGAEKNVVKRIIGLPGDVVTVVKGKLYINNNLYEEDYLDEENTKTFKEVSFTIRVPEGYLFVMGDNRDVSRDSRTIGSFKVQALVGIMME